ncbi:MAG: response regulator [Hyphomonadaceae bacterium]
MSGDCLVALAMKLMRALIVTAHESLRREAVHFLEPRSFDCVEATDGISALQFVSPDAIDLIVADVRLPKLDGPQFLDIVIEGAFGASPPPLIMCSATLHEHVWVRKLGLQGVTLLDWPFTPAAFTAALEAAFPAG